MKKLFKYSAQILATGLLLATAAVVNAKEFYLEADTIKDTLAIINDEVIVEDAKTGEKRKIKIHLPGQDNGIITVEKSSNKKYKTWENDGKDGKNGDDGEDGEKKSTGKPIFGITFSRIDLGLMKPHHGGDFKMDGANEIFKYRPAKTVNFGFDVFQAGYRFNRNFKVFASAGFDWTYIRLRKDIIMDPDSSPYASATPATEDFSKNRLTSTYLRLPLTFEFRSDDQRTKFAAGPITGFLLKGTQRYRNEDGDRIKRKGDFGYAPFQYGAFARFGVGDMGVYAKYYFNDMFDQSPAGQGIQNLTFGLTLGF